MTYDEIIERMKAIQEKRMAKRVAGGSEEAAEQPAPVKFA